MDHDDVHQPSDAVRTDRRSLLTKVGVGAAAVWVAPAILSMPVAAASACSCGTNLIVNPSGESYTGNPAIDTGVGFATPDSWTLTNNFRALNYRNIAPGLTSAPSQSQFTGPPTVPTPAQLGSVMFAGSWREPFPPGAPPATATQTISLTGCAARIDAGTAGYSLSAWLGGYDTQNDRMELQATFLDGVGAVIGASAVLTVTNTDRGNVTGFLFRRTPPTATVPIGTRSVRIVMTSIMVTSPRYNGVADLLDFHLTCP